MTKLNMKPHIKRVWVCCFLRVRPPSSGTARSDESWAVHSRCGARSLLSPDAFILAPHGRVPAPTEFPSVSATGDWNHSPSFPLLHALPWERDPQAWPAPLPPQVVSLGYTCASWATLTFSPHWPGLCPANSWTPTSPPRGLQALAPLTYSSWETVAPPVSFPRAKVPGAELFPHTLPALPPHCSSAS